MRHGGGAPSSDDHLTRHDSHFALAHTHAGGPSSSDTLEVGTRCIPIKSLGIFKNKKLRGRLKAALPRDEVELVEVISKRALKVKVLTRKGAIAYVKVRAFKKRCRLTPPSAPTQPSEPSDAQRPAVDTTVEQEIEPSSPTQVTEEMSETETPSLEAADEVSPNGLTPPTNAIKPSDMVETAGEHSKTTDRVSESDEAPKVSETAAELDTREPDKSSDSPTVPTTPTLPENQNPDSAAEPAEPSAPAPQASLDEASPSDVTESDPAGWTPPTTDDGVRDTYWTERYRRVAVVMLSWVTLRCQNCWVTRSLR